MWKNANSSETVTALELFPQYACHCKSRGIRSLVEGFTRMQHRPGKIKMVVSPVLSDTLDHSGKKLWCNVSSWSATYPTRKWGGNGWDTFEWFQICGNPPTYPLNRYATYVCILNSVFIQEGNNSNSSRFKKVALK